MSHKVIPVHILTQNSQTFVQILEEIFSSDTIFDKDHLTFLLDQKLQSIFSRNLPVYVYQLCNYSNPEQKNFYVQIYNNPLFIWTHTNPDTFLLICKSISPLKILAASKIANLLRSEIRLNIISENYPLPQNLHRLISTFL